VPLIYLSCAWVAGIYLGSKFAPPLALILIGLIPLPLLFRFGQHRKAIVLAAVCLIALFGGTFCFQTSQPCGDESCLQFYNDQEVKIKGMVNADPEIRDKATHIRLSDIKIWRDNGWQEVSGDALLFVPRYPTCEYGDVLLVKGKLDTPPQLGDFDYKGYLASQGIYSTMLYPEIEKDPETSKGVKPLEWVYSLRNRLFHTLAKVLPEPQASLAQGIILGIRYNIPASIKDDFVRTGTAHILAISGINLSIVAGMLLSIGIWLFGKRRHIYLWLALGTIWLYTLLTGMNPPVVRGAIMASLFLTAELLGRQRTAITSLAFAAAIMVGINPQILWDASFQLSFLAMAGLIFIAPPFQTVGRKAVNAAMGEKGIGVSLANIITDSLSVTLAATIAVWPLIAYYFGIVSLVGPLATFLALPALPGIIVAGALAGLIGLVFLPAAQAIGWLAWLFTSYMLLVVDGLAPLPLSSIEVGSVDPALILIYYLVLAAAIWLGSDRSRLGNWVSQATTRLKSGASKSTTLVSQLPKRWIIPPLLVLAILASVAAATMPDNNLHVSFLNVGEGDAILIQKGNQQILIDGGPSPQAISLELGDKMPFWDRTIELVILTHPHADHLAGLVEVLQRYQVKQVLYPHLDYTSPLYQEWPRLVEEKGIKRTQAKAGQEIDLGEGVVIRVLNPKTPQITGTESDIDSDIENNGSIVLRLSLDRVSFLLTADIMRQAEFELINHRADLASTVLKVAHHGSKTSTTPEFLAAVNPRVAVISVGEDNPFGHPRDEVVERLEEKTGQENIFRTDKQGTIEFITDGERLWVRVERKNNSP
jgi:competence protein ComEC